MNEAVDHTLTIEQLKHYMNKCPDTLRVYYFTASDLKAGEFIPVKLAMVNPYKKNSEIGECFILSD